MLSRVGKHFLKTITNDDDVIYDYDDDDDDDVVDDYDDNNTLEIVIMIIIRINLHHDNIEAVRPLIWMVCQRSQNEFQQHRVERKVISPRCGRKCKVNKTQHNKMHTHTMQT